MCNNIGMPKAYHNMHKFINGSHQEGSFAVLTGKAQYNLCSAVIV